MGVYVLRMINCARLASPSSCLLVSKSSIKGVSSFGMVEDDCV